jgi:hypothetical protein
VFNRARKRSAFGALLGTGDPFPIQDRATSRSLLGDRMSPRIVIGDWHNLQQLIRIADADY